ncbi:hypothetical protein [Mucilaginibacter flavidus]|uniref:hypothetical protein n=1 Tax=Mucilaginibacter flavidus TaxID=2949309 RepID=UPI002091EAAA|nr:hypothetical protein [Mucilaginibacter flavidus]MCO5949696.1 hypothetical protein [Mucilaginibacter flavidus]
MTKREKYHLVFKKLVSSSGTIFFEARSELEDYFDLAIHISQSDKIHTVSQINALDRVRNGYKADGFWGEVFGSPLYIYASNNTVEVGEGDTFLGIEDYKELLQEWLIFITS